MNPMQQDLRSLGLHLWPDDTPLRPRVGSRRAPAPMRSRLGMVALGTLTFAVVFGVIALSLVIAHGRRPAPAPTASLSAPATVIGVEITVPRNGLTFQVARGSILALHLHYKGTTPNVGWTVGKGSGGAGIDFQPEQVPFPGSHPPSSALDLYVAFRFPSDGSTQLVIGIPMTCPPGVRCLPPTEFIEVRSVTPPVRTGTVTGELATCASPTSSTADCVDSSRNSILRFHNSRNEAVVATTDVFGDYSVELAPGTWQVATVPPSFPGQRSTVTVAAGGIIVLDMRVLQLRSGTGAIIGGIYRCFALQPISGSQALVSGTVDVYRSGGISASQGPTVAEESVAAGGMYVIVLAPGTYTLVGHWTLTNLPPPTATVTVNAGRITTQNLAYQGCK